MHLLTRQKSYVVFKIYFAAYDLRNARDYGIVSIYRESKMVIGNVERARLMSSNIRWAGLGSTPPKLAIFKPYTTDLSSLGFKKRS